MPTPGLYAPPSQDLIAHSQQTRLQSALLCQWAREQRAVSAHLQALARALRAWSKTAG
jgi:hypothetical protein